MATKKQQRRRQKLKRHEYEEVYVDDEGSVLPPEEAEELGGDATGAQGRADAEAAPDDPRRPRARAAVVAEDGQRGPLFFPLMLITVMLLGRS